MIESLWLGRVDYAEALALQQQCVDHVHALRQHGTIRHLLLLLEHPPVLTLGRNARRENILASDARLAARGITVHAINRGGDVTYHGPGQLVGYPIFDLRSLTGPAGGRLGPVDFVRQMEEALLRLCGGYGIAGARVAGRTGVWVGPSGSERKIAAIGVHISRGITSHGFALNVTTDPADFQWIVPCGIADRDVTSLQIEMPAAPSLAPPLEIEAVAHRAAACFGQVFGLPVQTCNDQTGKDLESLLQTTASSIPT